MGENVGEGVPGFTVVVASHIPEICFAALQRWQLSAIETALRGGDRAAQR